jgi:penicillin amidase
MKTGTLHVQGLQGTVEILTDEWGVPHIYAQNITDLFFAQGFQAARLRLWQMDMWRRRGLGRVAEVMGERYAAQDAMARLLLYRRDLTDEAKEYGEKASEIIAGFVAGVNAYVAAVRAGQADLPIEFKALEYQPDFWDVEDIHRIRAGGRHDNAREEVLRAVTTRQFGAEAERLRKPLSNDWVTSVPEGLDLGDIDPALLADFNQFMVFMSAADPNLPDGSNHWAVAGGRTDTGRPILANDPHREMSLPPLRYLCHLVAPGMDVIGAAEPYRPGITMGHNQNVAFGLTIFPLDQEDLYVYETNEDGTRYRYKGEWVDFDFIDEEIMVRGGDPVTKRLRFSRHGPVVAERPERRRAYALRAVWLEPGGVPYFKAGLGFMFAKSIEDGRKIAAVHVSPGNNFIFADIEGNIGLRPGGMMPGRPGWDGLMPVPGDGRYEWDSLLSVSELLDVVNPPEGWTANGNHFNVPVAAEAKMAVSLETEPFYRYRRIEEVLNAAEKYSLKDSLALQLDAMSIPARELTALLGDLEFADPQAEEARKALVAWDHWLGKDSREAALFQIWWRSLLLPQTMALHLRSHGVQDADAAIAHIMKSTDTSKTPDLWIRMVKEKAQSREMIALVEDTLSSAMAMLRDRGIKTWGDLHKLSLPHPLTDSLVRYSGLTAEAFAAGEPAPIDGDGDTVNNTGFRPDWIQRLGAGVRLVLDVGAWDNSLAMAEPGQSGRHDDRHFRDLHQSWLKKEAFTLLYSRPRVEENCRERLILADNR